MRIVAALFVQHNGIYYNQPNIEPYGLPLRDAKAYNDDHPVIAHPPCQRWGHFATGSFKHKGKYKVGDDGGCFASAIASVRRCGGVLEHPAGSKAWAANGLKAPPVTGGWIEAGDGIGFTCCVFQGHYGHPAAKPTWLYAVNCELPELTWGKPTMKPQGISSSAKIRAKREGAMTVLSKKKREATPIPFRDVLIQIARTVEPQMGEY